MSRAQILAIALAVLSVIPLWLLLKLIQWWLNRRRKGINSTTNFSIRMSEQEQPVRTEKSIKNSLRRLKDLPSKIVVRRQTKRRVNQDELKKMGSQLLQMLKQRAVEKVDIRRAELSGGEVDLLIRALDIAHDKFRESLFESDLKTTNSIQHWFQSVSESIRDEVRSEYGEKYGLSDQDPSKIKELIALGSWCEEQNYQLEQARELIDLGGSALKCFETISGPLEIKVAQRSLDSLPERWKQVQEERNTLKRDLQEERQKSQELGIEPKRLEAEIDQLNIDLKARDSELLQLKKELSAQKVELNRLEADLAALVRENLTLKNGSNDAQITLGKLHNIVSIAEQLQHGSRGLFHYLPGGLQSQTGLSCLIYFSLFRFSSGVVQGDDLQQQLMLLNLQSIANRCKEYGGTKFGGFSLAYESIIENIERDYGIKDMDQKKQELASHCSFQHADLDFFSQILRDLRSMASMPLSPFYLDANKNHPQAAN